VQQIRARLDLRLRADREPHVGRIADGFTKEASLGHTDDGERVAV
jgi:hypothetical protein